MDTTRICERCRKPVDRFAPAGLCPNCLLESGLNRGPAEAGSAPDSPRHIGGGVGQREGNQSAIGNIRYFGDYELVEEIARGGMGVVYKARQVSLNRTVAVKMILAGQLASAAEVLRFRHEAESAANLQHPGIVSIHEVGEHQGQHYFSMDYVEGRDLTALVRDGPLPPKRAAAYVRTIAEAIHYAHQKGVLHRDLKPSNVLLDQNHQPRVTDFGLAKRLTDSELGNRNRELTLSGQMLGTPNYMPPEQARGRRSEIGPQSDVYSLGGILFFLLTGRPPFLGETLEEVLSQVLNTEPVSPRLLTPTVPRDLETICLKCLQKEGRRRYQSAQDLTEELGHFMRGESIRARPASRVEKVWRWCQRKPAVASFAATTVLLLLAVAVGSPIAAFRINRERRQAEQNAKKEEQQHQRAESAVTRLEIERAESLFTADSSSPALAYLSRLLRQQPTNRIVAERLLSALSFRNFCLPILPLPHSTNVVSAKFSPEGLQVLTVTKDHGAHIWDSRTGQAACPPLEHQGQISSAYFSPDGKRVITAGKDGVARLWDARTGESLLKPLIHDGPVRFAQFSPSGRMVVTVGEDKTVRLWDAQTGGPAIPPLTNRAGFYFAAFSPDDSKLVTASYDSRAQLWDARTGRPIASYPHDTPISGGARRPQFSPDGNRLALMNGFDGVLRSTAANQSAVVRLRHELEVVSVRFSPDGRFVATASLDHTVQVWDAASGQSLTSPLKHSGWMSSVNFSFDAQSLVTASRDKTARIWEARTGKVLSEPLQHSSPVTHAEFSMDGQHLLTLAEGATVWIWDTRLGQPLTIRLKHGDVVRRSNFSPDGERVVTASWDGTARLWNAQNGKPLSPFMRLGSRVWEAQFSHDGGRVAICSDANIAEIHDGLTGYVVAKTLQHSAQVRYAEFSRDNKRVVTASDDRTAAIWDASTGDRLGQLGHAAKLWHAGFSPDGHLVVTASADRTAGVWDAYTFLPTIKALRHDDEVYWAEFSPEGSRIVTISKDKTARIWDVRTGMMLGQPLVHADEPGPIHTVCFNHDGSLLATVAGDAAQVWDAHTFKPITGALKHGNRVDSVRFSPDGSRLVTACYDGAIRIWEPHSGHLLGEPLKHESHACYAEFSPDSRRVVSASPDKSARIWDVPAAPLPVPDWLCDLAEAVAGQRVNSEGVSENVSVDELFRLRQKLSGISGKNYYEIWATWFFGDSATRTISPSSSVSIPQYVQSRIEDGSLESLREAIRLSPTNAMALSRLARKCLADDKAVASRRLGEAELYIKRAVEFAPNDPQVLQLHAEVQQRIAELSKY